MKGAMDCCSDLGIETDREYGWQEPESLEDLFYRLGEKGVIDSDLVDQMIAMYRIRWMIIQEKLEEGVHQLAHQIVK